MPPLIRWSLLLCALLCACSIWFAIAGVRSRGSLAPPPPVATVKQIMIGIVAPASDVVYRSVSTVISAAGTEETAPRTEADWARIGANATALAEAGRLLMEPPRAKNGAAWSRMSQRMIDASQRAVRAVNAKDTEGLLAAGEAINTSCDNCHREYAPDLEL